MSYTITFDSERLLQLYRLLAPRLAARDLVAVEFLSWLNDQLSKKDQGNVDQSE